MFTRLEHLPGELYFIIFTYLNGVDLWIAFSNLNTRINRLLDNVACQSLDLTDGSVTYNAFCAYVSDRCGVRSSFISSLKLDPLSLPSFGTTQLFSSFNNSPLERLTLITSPLASVKTTEIVTFLGQMMIANEQRRGRLKSITLTFEKYSHFYEDVLTMIIKRNISFNTMIFNVTSYIPKAARSVLYEPLNDTNLHVAIDSRTMLKHTIRLSLSLKYCSELVLLLQRGVLPLLQQLNVTFEAQQAHIEYDPAVRFTVDESNLLTTDTSRLHTLSLRNLHMCSALYFIRFLRLTQLKTLCLIHVFDKTLTRIAEFERVISVRLCNLITLQFTLRFPIDSNLHNDEPHCTRDTAILQNDTWHSRGWFVRDFIDTAQKCFIVYTVPYALSYHRFLRNHTFIPAQRPNFVDLRTNEVLLWTCTNRNPSAVTQSLKGLSQARHLHWNFQHPVSPLVFSSSDNLDSVIRWPSMQLRSLCLMTLSMQVEDGANMILHLLIVCPRLQTLAVRSTDLIVCLKKKAAVTLPSLDHLHLYLDKLHQMVDAVSLASVFPNISYLSTGKTYLDIDMKLGHAVLDLIKALPHLRRLRFNDISCTNLDDSNQPYNNLLVEMLRNSEQLRSINCYVAVYDDRQLFIWF